MPLAALFAILLLVGLGLVGGSTLALRATGARAGTARRLAGPREVKVGTLLGGEEPPARAVRVAGRVRCREPLDAGDGERLVAFHRDVEVRSGRRWRPLERLRESRSFELWDHDGSLTIDPSLAAEPLITIPKVWRGGVGSLEEPHASAAARVAERHGPVVEARAVTRTLSVTDRLLVLARPVRAADGSIRLEPPEGGYLVSNLLLPDAMRILGGRSRLAAAAGTIGLGAGIALASIGAVGAVAALILA